jgi:hypothetical protein
MKKLTAFFASLSLVLVLSAPIAKADEQHTGIIRPPMKGDVVLSQVVAFVLSLESIVPLI